LRAARDGASVALVARRHVGRHRLQDISLMLRGIWFLDRTEIGSSPRGGVRVGRHGVSRQIAREHLEHGGAEQ
jgi:hypothetical protein